MSRQNDGMWLNLAINYGSRAEIVDAVQAIGRKISEDEIVPDQIDEQMISAHLYTAGCDDPDLLIRTAGEMRVSNFLLWQISYSEIWVTENAGQNSTRRRCTRRLRISHIAIVNLAGCSRKSLCCVGD